VPSKRIAILLVLTSIFLSFALLPLAPGASAKWKYFRAGNAADSTATPRGGFALMGGGAQDPPDICRRKTPLSVGGITVHRAPPGTSFNLKDWKGTGGDDYKLFVIKGELKALDSNHGIY